MQRLLSLVLAACALACTVDAAELAGGAGDDLAPRPELAELVAPVVLRVDIQPLHGERICLAPRVAVVDGLGAVHVAPAGSCATFDVALPLGETVIDTDTTVGASPVGYTLTVRAL